MNSSRRLPTAASRRVGANEFGRLVQNMLQPATCVYLLYSLHTTSTSTSLLLQYLCTDQRTTDFNRSSSREGQEVYCYSSFAVDIINENSEIEERRGEERRSECHRIGKEQPVVFSSLNSLRDLRSLIRPHANVNGAREAPETEEMEQVACSALLLLLLLAAAAVPAAAATLLDSLGPPPPPETALTPRSSTIRRSE